IDERKSGLLFQTASGAHMLQSNILRDSLHPILKKLKHVQRGFNIFRRCRMTHLEKPDCPASLKHFWSRHAPKPVSLEFRLEWTERSGLGFSVGPVQVVRSAA